jgi:hypothetical protein
MRAAWILGVALMLGACSDDETGKGDTADTQTTPDTEVSPDVPDTADPDVESDTGPDGDTLEEVTNPPTLSGCLPRPELAPPSSTLPCDLIPPGLSL